MEVAETALTIERGEDNHNETAVRIDNHFTQDSDKNERYYETKDTFLDTISTSWGGGTSLFTSCEPSHQG